MYTYIWYPCIHRSTRSMSMMVWCDFTFVSFLIPWPRRASFLQFEIDIWQSCLISRGWSWMISNPLLKGLIFFNFSIYKHIYMYVAIYLYKVLFSIFCLQYIGLPNSLALKMALPPSKRLHRTWGDAYEILNDPDKKILYDTGVPLGQKEWTWWTWWWFRIFLCFFFWLEKHNETMCIYCTHIYLATLISGDLGKLDTK